ncbi:DUF1990 domain-containing protein [Glycomyces halotolerans]
MDFDVDYPEVGATRGGPMPAGYRHLHRETELRAPLAEAAEILMSWGLHERCGLRPESASPRAVPGAEVVLHLAWLRIPCQVVWAHDGPERAGFAYGSMPGHPENGEAAFVLDRIDADRTRFTVRSFSRPGRWITRLGGPVSRAAQRRFTDRFTDRMRTACAEP